jgi:hypothetical protein
MPTLARTRSLARLVLVWFALFVAAATAGTIARPQQLELICAADGAVRLQALNADGTPAAATGSGMDCPLCLLPGAPPPVPSLAVMPPLPLAAAIAIPVSRRLAELALPPLPPRGPPSLLPIA